MYRSRAALVSTLACGVLLLGPPPGLAAEVAFDAACYSTGDPIAQTGRGFTPNRDVAESLSLFDQRTGRVLRTLFAPLVTAGPQGEFFRRARAPALARRNDRREGAISTFTDQADPDNTAVVQWTLSDWFVDIRAWVRGRGKPRGHMVVDAYGWTFLDPTLWAHYFRRGSLVKTVRIGTLTGPCRDLRKRVRQFPFRRVRPGIWSVFFSTTRRFDRQNDPFWGYRVRVPR